MNLILSEPTRSELQFEAWKSMIAKKEDIGRWIISSNSANDKEAALSLNSICNVIVQELNVEFENAGLDIQTNAKLFYSSPTKHFAKIVLKGQDASVEQFSHHLASVTTGTIKSNSNEVQLLNGDGKVIFTFKPTVILGV